MFYWIEQKLIKPTEHVLHACICAKLLCLGGRSHEAYSSSFVCLFVIPSVSSVLRRTLNDEP